MNLSTGERMGEYEWLKPLTDFGSNVVGTVFGPKRSDQPSPPVINVNVPQKSESAIPWTPIAIGGGILLLGAVLLKKKR